MILDGVGKILHIYFLINKFLLKNKMGLVNIELYFLYKYFNDANL